MERVNVRVRRVEGITDSSRQEAHGWVRVRQCHEKGMRTPSHPACDLPAYRQTL